MFLTACLPRSFERYVKPAADIVVDARRDADAAALCQPLKSRRYIYAVAVNIVLVDDDIAHIDSKTNVDLLVGRPACVAFRHTALNVHSVQYRVDCA